MSQVRIRGMAVRYLRAMRRWRRRKRGKRRSLSERDRGRVRDRALGRVQAGMATDRVRNTSLGTVVGRAIGTTVGVVVSTYLHRAGWEPEWGGFGVALLSRDVLCAGGESSRDSAGDDAPGTSSQRLVIIEN